MILEGKEERDFRWASALYTESGPAPRDASGTSTQTQNADPGWAQKIRPWPGGAGHFLPTVLSGDRQAGPRPGPPRRVVRRSSPRLRNQPPPSVRGPPAPEPAARHDRRARAPQPSHSPPGAVARPGSDRKSCHFFGTAVPGAEPGFKDPGVFRTCSRSSLARGAAEDRAAEGCVRGKPLALSEGRWTSPGARGTLPSGAWPCLGQAASSRRWRGVLAAERAQVVAETMVAIQSTAEHPPPESPKGPPARLLCRPNTSVSSDCGLLPHLAGTAGAGKEMPGLGPNGDAGSGAIRPARLAVLV